MFLGWYDPDKKKTMQEKIAAAARRYERKRGQPPAIALVNPAQLVAIDEMDVRPAAHVAVNTIYVGVAEDDEREEPLAA
ncbi:MAG: hypothetical protein IT333_04800 [Thermomicrobiales bacterium]|nr:hypothetical protein [Thermomicrobiales bacterium]